MELHAKHKASVWGRQPVAGRDEGVEESTIGRRVKEGGLSQAYRCGTLGNSLMRESHTVTNIHDTLLHIMCLSK